MLHLKRLALAILLHPLLFPSQAVPRYYRPEDWVTFTDFRYISGVASDLTHVYLATNGGIARFDRLTRRWDLPLTTGDGLPEIPTRVVAPDAARRALWALTPQDLTKYDFGLERWTSFATLDGTPAGAVEAVGIGSQFVYARAGPSTFRMDLATEVWEVSPAVPAEVKWYGGKQELKSYPFLAPYYVSDSHFRRYDMTSLEKDGFDIWVGTAGYGLLHYNSQTLESEYWLFGLAGESVRALEKDGESLWLGGDSEGITCWNQEEDRWCYYDEETSYGLLSSKVSDIVSDSLWVWFGTSEGVARYGRSKGDWKTFTVFDGLWTSSITALGLDGDALWIGTQDGLCKMEKKDRKISRVEDLRYLRINEIVADPSYVWVATSKGVFVLERAKGEWGRLESPDQSLGLGTNSILLDGREAWFGTRRKGVLVYRGEEGGWQSYRAPLHLPTNEVLCLAGDKANLWAGTPSGLWRLNRETGDWTTYTTADGLVSDRVEGILIVGDYVYFGTPKGLTRFWWKDPFLTY